MTNSLAHWNKLITKNRGKKIIQFQPKYNLLHFSSVTGNNVYYIDMTSVIITEPVDLLELPISGTEKYVSNNFGICLINTVRSIKVIKQCLVTATRAGSLQMNQRAHTNMLKLSIYHCLKEYAEL